MIIKGRSEKENRHLLSKYPLWVLCSVAWHFVERKEQPKPHHSLHLSWHLYNAGTRSQQRCIGSFCPCIVKHISIQFDKSLSICLSKVWVAGGQDRDFPLVRVRDILCYSHSQRRAEPRVAVSSLTVHFSAWQRKLPATRPRVAKIVYKVSLLLVFSGSLVVRERLYLPVMSTKVRGACIATLFNLCVNAMSGSLFTVHFTETTLIMSSTHPRPPRLPNQPRWIG